MWKSTKCLRMMVSNSEIVKLHLNPPQLHYFMVRPKLGVYLWGRGTGKTEGPGALHAYECCMTMPRSNNAIASTTYDKVINTVLPAIQMTWEKLGLKENQHYWIRKYAPEEYRIEKPFRAPGQPYHLVHFYTGACLRLMSLDRPGMNNGVSIDSFYGDEAKFFKRDKIREILPALRGGAGFFGHLPSYGRVIFTTDLPDDPDHWLFEYEKLMDKEAVELIIETQITIKSLWAEAQQTKSDRKSKSLIKQINNLERLCNDIRQNLTEVHFASTLENIHALGFSTLENYYRNLTELEYHLQILTDRNAKAQGLFYANFQPSEGIHGYYAINENSIDQLTMRDSYLGESINPDCRWYKDWIGSEPLEIGLDYNSYINWYVCAQEIRGEFRVLNSQYVESPYKLRDLAKAFDRHWAAKKSINNQVNYYYDKTAISETPGSAVSSSDEFSWALENLGWAVNKIYTGAQMSFKSRYLLYQELFEKDNTKLPSFKINIGSNEDLIHTMKYTKSEIKQNGFVKDKSSERKDSGVPRHKATHNTEALDQLVQGLFTSRLETLGNALLIK